MSTRGGVLELRRIVEQVGHSSSERLRLGLDGVVERTFGNRMSRGGSELAVPSPVVDELVL